MSSSNVAIVIASISGAVSLTAAFGVEWLRQHSNSAKLAQDDKLTNLRLTQDEALAKLKLAQDRELENFRNAGALALEETKDRLARGRETATKAEEAARLIGKYRDPLLRSAYDLQSRIYNVCRRGGFRGYRDPEYFRFNTMFLFGEFLGWLEIIRREIQFLDLGAVQATKDLLRTLQEVQDQIATTSELRDDLYLYRGHQRAIGELMLVRTEGKQVAGRDMSAWGMLHSSRRTRTLPLRSGSHASVAPSTSFARISLSDSCGFSIPSSTSLTS